MNRSVRQEEPLKSMRPVQKQVSKSRCQQGCVNFWRLWGRIHFQAHSAVGRTQLFAIVGLRSLFSCWLSGQARCLSADPAHISAHASMGCPSDVNGLGPAPTLNLSDDFHFISLTPVRENFLLLRAHGIRLGPCR